MSNAGGALVVGGGKTTLADVCLTAKTLPDGASTQGRVQVGWEPSFTAPGDAWFDPRFPESDRCAGLGATAVDDSRILRDAAPGERAD